MAYEQRVEGLRIADEDAFLDELCFCLLSGYAVPYELALSAANFLRAFSVFSRRRSDAELYELLLDELSRPQFYPRRSDGSLRRFRFPSRKSALIVAARRWVLAEGPLLEALSNISAETRRREFMLKCPGVGPKTASWILRNAGLGHNLAVLDTHVLRALAAVGRIGDYRLPRDYLAVEAQFIRWSAEVGAPPAAFDLFVWEVQRGDLPLS